MDITAHISKIIANGSNGEDWMDFINQLKQCKCARVLLTQIYTVALNNISAKRTTIYKKLLVGRANLENEFSPDNARKTLQTANLAYIECAVVCVYYAQFEYKHGKVKEAARIISTGKCGGRMPSVLLKVAYDNVKKKKFNLFDGIIDPWDEKLNDITDTATILQNNTQVLQELSDVKNDINNTAAAGKAYKFKDIGKPTRCITKAQSTSKMLKEAKIKIPTEQLKEKLGLIVGENYENKFTKVHNKPDTPVSVSNKENIPEKTYGPSLSPFMKHTSPLVNRSFSIPFKCTDNDPFQFDLHYSPEHNKATEIKKNNVSRTFDELLQKAISPTEKNFVSHNENLTAHCSNRKKKEQGNESISINTDKLNVQNGSLENDKLISNIQSLNCIKNSTDRFQKLSNFSSGLTDLLEDFDINGKTMDMKSARKEQLPSKTKCSANKIYENQQDNISSYVNIPQLLQSSKKQGPLSDVTVFPYGDRYNNHKLSSNHLVESNSKSIGMSNEDLDINLCVNKSSKVQKQKKSNIVNCSEEQCKVSRQTLEKVESFSLPKQSQQYSLGNSQFAPKKSDGFNFSQISDVEKSVENGLSILQQNGFNISSQLNQIPALKDSKVFVVNNQCYKQNKRIGSGGSCKVYEVVGPGGHVYALKKVILGNLDSFLIDSYLKEINWLEKMKGVEYIIELKNWERTKDYLLLVMEKGDRDLAYVLKMKEDLSGDEIKSYWKQMLTAVQVIHDVGIVHADLKPANFLFVGSILKLIDFGIASGIQANKTSVTCEHRMGTLNYMSPEALSADAACKNGATRISRASDVWSLGCMLYLMVFKKTPYGHITKNFQKQAAIERGDPIDYNGVKDPLLLDCLQGCLKFDKRQRYSIQELLSHQYLHR